LQLRECLLLGVRPEWNEFVRPGPDLRRLPEAADASLTSGTVRPDLFVTICECFLAVVSS
jgi:hypothetical protein